MTPDSPISPNISDTLTQLKHSTKILENQTDFQIHCLKGQIVNEILKAMEKEGVTKTELAKRLNVPQKNITDLLDEKPCADFSIENLAKLSLALHRTVRIHLDSPNSSNGSNSSNPSFKKAAPLTLETFKGFEKYHEALAPKA